MTVSSLVNKCVRGAECEMTPDSVFSEILKGLKLGIVVLDTGKRSVFFHNQWANEIIKNRIDLNSFEEMRTVFRLGIDDSHEKGAPGFEQKQIRLGSDILGYTVYYPLESYTSIFLQDITEKERLESIAEAVETTNNLGYIFSQIRHELGNPVNSIKMTLEVLRSNINSYPTETVLKYVERAQADLLRVEYLLKFLKNFSLYEDLEIRSHNLHSFMRNFLVLAEGAFHDKGISLSTRLEADAIFGLVDPRALQQVMLNLLSNAVDAVQGRSCPEIVIGMKKSGKLILIVFEDNGCGIPESHTRKMFTAFFTTKPDGTGLGLPIAAKVLAKMNGTIEISSRENVGTTVTVTIPEGSASDSVDLPDVFRNSSQHPW